MANGHLILEEVVLYFPSKVGFSLVLCDREEEEKKTYFASMYCFVLNSLGGFEIA